MIRLKPKKTEYDKVCNGKLLQNVAIYCKISKGDKEKSSSIEWQVKGLMQVVKQHPNWQLYKIYIDIKSDINIKKRKQFQQMIKDCINGKVNIVLTKSMSRFSRNTVDIMNVVRLLDRKGVKIMFDSEKFTYDKAAEMAFEIQAAINEEESVQKSKNIRWGLQKRQSEGHYAFNATNLLGYRKFGDDGLEIVEDQAKIVRRIFAEFLAGKKFYQIARGLERDGLLTGAGNSKWYPNKIKQILQNEKYVGDAHLGKYTTTDFRNNIVKKNEGLVQSYYVENGHPAIISREDFEKVQNIIGSAKN